MSVALHDVSAAVLAGGLGTRLRAAVPDLPKVLAPVAGRPFLTHLLDRLARASVREVVLLTGHAAGRVRAALGDEYSGMRIRYSVEPAPLGTAGAVRRALPLLRSDTILLLNGDSYCDVDLLALRRFHDGAAASLALTRVEDASRFGRVRVAANGRLHSFEEKRPAAGPGWINAGVYLLPRVFIEDLDPARPASLERDLLPALVAAGRVRGFRAGGRFIDIGTPESYAEADAFFADAVPARAGGVLMLDDVDLLVCGAGPVGCVVAERAADILGWKVLVVDQRRHVAGNCHDSPHKNGVMVHNYGPHYFRTNDADLLQYLSRFTEWIPANYEVKSLVNGRLYPFPINLTTLEQFFGRDLDAASAERLLAGLRLTVENPRNSEEFVLGRVGKKLYEAFYLNYTLKQWGVHPRDLDPQVCGRIPVRLDRDHRYVGHRFQVMPKRGFTALFAAMLRSPRIRVLLDCPFREVRGLVRPRRATVYSGPVDDYFDCRLGKLPYRSLNFDFVPYRTEYRQPCVQINYPNDYAYTRSVEVKHVTGQRHAETVVSYETPQAAGEPYYPVPTAPNAALYQAYRRLAEEETARRHVYFCGRLAQYRYFNTDEVIAEALACFERIRKRFAGGMFRAGSMCEGIPTRSASEG